MTQPIVLNLSGYTDVPPGKIATIVTSLEMRQRPRPRPTPIGVSLRRVENPTAEWYRALYRRVGEDWLWFSRLTMTDDQLLDVIRDPMVEVHAIDTPAGRETGIAELDFRVPGEAELAFFGFEKRAIGHGWGSAAMAMALSRMWRGGVDRVWVHTCTFDDPRALGFYRRMGFVPYAQAVEVDDDPRLTGATRRDAATHVPIFEPPSAGKRE